VGVGLAYTGGHARATIKSYKSGVHDSVGTSYLLSARGPYISCSGKGVVVVCAAFYEQGFGLPLH
jgi:hypothetical protein